LEQSLSHVVSRVEILDRVLHKVVALQDNLLNEQLEINNKTMIKKVKSSQKMPERTEKQREKN